MTMHEYLKSRGLRVTTLAQQMGVTKQAVSMMGTKYTPTARTLKIFVLPDGK